MEKIIRLKNGKEFKVTSETYKYYVIKEGLQFRKADQNIEVISREEVQEDKESAQPKKKKAPAKKTSKTSEKGE